MSNPRILVVEDEAAVALDIREKLRRLDYEVAGLASSGQEAVAQAAERHPDLVLMDITLRGEMDGVEAADRIQKYLQIPVIYLTAHSDARTLVRAKLTEPYGYILKPFEETELRISIEMGLHKHKSSSERSQLDKAVLQDLLDRALRDSLTGLYNRRYLEEELPREVSLARRTGTAFSLIMLDVDHFKSINDQFGHGAGDTVLAQLAKLLLNLFRTEDIVCRLGGDEMLIVLKGTDLKGAQVVAHRLHRKVAELKMEYNGQQLDSCHVSLGLAAFPDHGSTAEILLQKTPGTRQHSGKTLAAQQRKGCCRRSRKYRQT